VTRFRKKSNENEKVLAFHQFGGKAARRHCAGQLATGLLVVKGLAGYAELGIRPVNQPFPLINYRSALEWVVDQYQVSEDARSGICSDPNRKDAPEYIVRLVGQVVRVSLETVRLVRSLPGEYSR
jgi:hypothetical protein